MYIFLNINTRLMINKKYTLTSINDKKVNKKYTLASINDKKDK